MLVADLAARISAQVPALAGRVEGAAELTELMRQKALPQAAAAAFVLPLGLRPRGEGDASAGAFLQMVDELCGVVLVVRSAGDVSGKKALPKVDELVWAVVLAVCGWEPAGAIAAMRLVRGQLLSVDAGSVQYQLDFALQSQLRILA